MAIILQPRKSTKGHVLGKFPQPALTTFTLNLLLLLLIIWKQAPKVVSKKASLSVENGARLNSLKIYVYLFDKSFLPF